MAAQKKLAKEKELKELRATAADRDIQAKARIEQQFPASSCAKLFDLLRSSSDRGLFLVVVFLTSPLKLSQ